MTVAAQPHSRKARVEQDPLAAFLAGLDRFLVEAVDARRIDAAHAIPAGVLQALAELGVFGVSLPEAYGGTGLGLAGAAAVVDTIARRDRAVATTVGLHLGLGTCGLVAFGTEEQRRRWLPDLAAGNVIAAFAATEPGAGSDLSRLATRATHVGGRIRVDGQKIYVTNGGLAGVFTIGVTTEGLGDAWAGKALVVLEKGDRGLVVGPEERKLGLRGSSTTPVRLDAVEVGMDRLLGPAADPLGHVLAQGRVVMAAGCCGTAQAALDLALAHVRLRQQFGRPLAAQPVVRAQLADMAATLHAMRALVHAAATAPALHDRERLSLSAKVFCSEADWAICDMGIQLHGGAGYIEDTGAALLLRDARVTRIFEGANDVLATRLGQLELLTSAARVGLEPPPEPFDDPHFAPLVAATRARGLSALRDIIVQHKLGRLAILHDAARAVGRYGDATSPLARHALQRLSAAACALHGHEALGTTEAICESLLDHASQP